LRKRVVVVLGTEGKEVSIYIEEERMERRRSIGQRWCPRRGFLFVNPLIFS
jgi:hypothetical protein